MLFFNALRTIRPCALITLSVLSFLLFSLVGLSGCLSLKSVVESALVCNVPSDDGVSSRISFFLNLKSADESHISLQLVSVDILRNGLWIPVTIEPRELDTNKIGGWQLLLANKAFQPGNYEKIKLVFGPEAILTWNEQSSALTLEKTVLELPFAPAFNLQNRSSESVFLVWDVAASFADADSGSLGFSLAT